MKSFFVALTLSVCWTPAAFAQAVYFHARSGPTALGINFGQDGAGQVSMSYKGYLYECQPPHYDVRPVQVLFIFHKPEGTAILWRKMGGQCTSPWNYTAPDHAQFGAYESSGGGDQELWLELRSLLFSQAGEETRFEVAFERDGLWDSDYGNNYQLRLQRH